MMPMMRGDEAIGAIVTSYAPSGAALPDKQRAVADLRRPGRHRHREHAPAQRTAPAYDFTEALEQQTATVGGAQVISKSPGGTESGFQAMLENATRVCCEDSASLWLREGDDFRIRRAHGAPEAYAEERQRELLLSVLVPGGLDSVVRTANSPLPDVEGWQAGHAHGDRASPRRACRRTDRSSGSRCSRTMNSWGVIGIYRQEVVAPSPTSRLSSSKNFAAQAVIAIENTRLLDELRQRTDDYRCSSRPPPPMCSRSSVARLSI